MSALAVPVPQVSWKTGAAPELEQPVEVGLAAVRYPEGVALAPESGLAKLGVFVYRLAGAGEEIWNEGEQQWQGAPGDLASLAALEPLALAPGKKGAPLPWQGVLVAAGQKDKHDAERFAAAAGGTPRYRLRAFAAAKRDAIEYAGLSAASAELAFVSAAEGKRFELVMEPEKIKECERMRFLLKDAALREAAYVELRASGGREVEIVNCDASGQPLASVRLAADGDIVLKPAPGKGVAIETATGLRYL